MPKIKDKSGAQNSQGLLIVINESKQEPSFYVLVSAEQLTHEVVAKLPRINLPIPLPSKEVIIKGIKQVGKFIKNHVEDLKDIIEKLKFPEDDETDETKIDIPETPTPLHPSPSRLKTLLDNLKKGFHIPLDISHLHLLAIVGIGVAVTSFYMLTPNVVNVSKSSIGGSCVICEEASNKKRLGVIVFNLTAERLQAIKNILHGPFGADVDGLDTCAILCNLLIGTTAANPFILCISSAERFSVAYRGNQACFLGGAKLDDDVITPILLGVTNMGNYRRGNFLIDHMNLQFVVIASSTVLDLLGYQEVVDCVLTKDYDNAGRIVQAALVRDPTLEDLHVAVIFLT